MSRPLLDTFGNDVERRKTQAEESAVATPPARARTTGRNRTHRADYLERNRAAWERWAPEHVARGRAEWVNDTLRWGLWGVPEDSLGLLRDLRPEADVVELGCGTAAISAWLARRGFRPTGVDFARIQLETAARFEREFDVRFPLLCANAERLHFADESFDCAISEYGASTWCDPGRWLPEASRLLRSGGLLVFVTSGATLISCTPDDGAQAGDRLVRDYFSRYRIEFEHEDAVEFHLTHGDWVRLLLANAFVLENLIETRPPQGAKPRYAVASPEWAQRWPSEEIWVARKQP